MKKYFLVLIILVASFLRLWKLSVNSPSLFGDELDVGYQAYSILKTGKDYYGNSWPIHFHSLAEWRTPLYLYSAVPTVAIFGISPLGVRLPAVIFGILTVWMMFLLINQLTKNQLLATVAAGLLAVNPWHLQYSRAGFEVTLLLLLLLLGLWLFFKSLANGPPAGRQGKYLWLSAVCFALTPWVYSTAKLFTPLLLLFLLVVWRKEIFSLSKKHLAFAFLAFMILILPITYSTFFGGGAQRFGYISVFTDPTTEPEVGTARLIDARARGETGAGLTPKLIDRVIHNKYTFWGSNVMHNFLQAFSTDFLFIKGDLNLRHSIGIGEFYKVEIIPLIFGIILFFAHSAGSGQNAKIKWFMVFWILAGVIPSAITREGGYHATRLILILPPLVFLIAYGLVSGLNLFSGKSRLLFAGIYLAFFFLSFSFYLHRYWVHYPTESERWWHSGFREGVQTIKAIDKDYEKVIISSANEPPWIFFAGWYEYPPADWQENFPIGNDVELSGFGKVSHIGKFYFGSPQGGIYDLGSKIDGKTLYLAVAKEMGANLILEPARTPSGLELIKAISYPSGEPAFYLFSGTK